MTFFVMIAGQIGPAVVVHAAVHRVGADGLRRWALRRRAVRPSAQA
ncbi:MAG: hypothetical protein ACXVUE_06295 [Solirubrobacteraceae bacterium]